MLNEAKTNLYYWYQYGWSAGTLNTGVHRLSTSDLSEVDVTGEVPDFHRDPLDAPILLDEEASTTARKRLRSARARVMSPAHPGTDM